MYKILLVCNAGMSTSMLVQRMEKAATEKGIEAEIIALPITDALSKMDDWDVVMLGPQVRHELDYGMMNGEKVLEAAIKVIDAK